MSAHELEFAIDRLLERWERNFMRPRHRKVLRETPLAQWTHRERTKRKTK